MLPILEFELLTLIPTYPEKHKLPRNNGVVILPSRCSVYESTAKEYAQRYHPPLRYQHIFNTSKFYCTCAGMEYSTPKSYSKFLKQQEVLWCLNDTLQSQLIKVAHAPLNSEFYTAGLLMKKKVHLPDNTWPLAHNIIVSTFHLHLCLLLHKDQSNPWILERNRWGIFTSWKVPRT